MQVPANLPDWMDGPAIRRKAKQWGVSYEAAKRRMQKELAQRQHHMRHTYG